MSNKNSNIVKGMSQMKTGFILAKKMEEKQKRKRKDIIDTSHRL